MAELRTDGVTGRSVLVAENRAERPNEYELAAGREHPKWSSPESTAGQSAQDRTTTDADAAVLSGCPFCRGHEHHTPAPVYESLDARGQWQVRVVPNKYPAITLPTDHGAFSDGLPAAEAASPATTVHTRTSAVPAIGVHEVVIEAGRHVDRISALSVGELRCVLEAYAARLRYWRGDGRFAYGLVFKNQGARAGASLSHLHSQLMAFPSLPPTVGDELLRAEREYRRSEICPYCRLAAAESAAGARTVHLGNGLIAFCPYASVQPYEVWLLPIEHQPSFEALPPTALDTLANVLHSLVARLESVVPRAAYNLLLRTAPWRLVDHAWCHWRIELLPRTTAFAGLELFTGLFINPVAPERAASKLRSS